MMKRLLLALITAATVVSMGSAPVQAVSGSDWRAGRIIDDNVFTNKGSMTVAEIQQFLNAKIGSSCDTYGQKSVTYRYPFGSETYVTTSRAVYADRNGNPKPSGQQIFTCLNNYHEVPKTSPGSGPVVNNYGSPNPGSNLAPGSKSAAQIIYDAAQVYNISPKVLLVTLEKEQGLLTDDWPLNRQYLYAMGANCPDSGPGGSANCDANYASFSLQMMEGASLFRYYLDNMQQPWWPYKKPFANNSIMWNVSERGCGSSQVYISSLATAALYTYTPYQPNQAALNNLYGTGDNCSAYGNRNFWRMFNDWFGTTRGDPFLWSVVETHIYDTAKNTEISTDNLHPGENYKVSVKVRNMGTEIWYRDGPNPIRLATFAPKNHLSRYCDTSWLSCSRPAKLVEDALVPGQEGHFEFTTAAVNELGEFREFLHPVLENREWMTNDTGYHIYSRTTNRYAWDWMSYGAWTDANRTIPADINNLERNQTVYITLRMRNAGASTWYNTGPNPVSVATAQPSRPDGKISPLCAAEWSTCSRPALMTESSVAPGSIATFRFPIKANAAIGEHREYFKPVVEFKGWGTDNPNHMYLKVTH